MPRNSYWYFQMSRREVLGDSEQVTVLAALLVARREQ